MWTVNTTDLKGFKAEFDGSSCDLRARTTTRDVEYVGYR
jgi:hypothetical protein